MPELTAAVGITRGLLDFAIAGGAPRDELLRRSGLVDSVLDDPDAHIPFAHYAALMQAAQILCGDPALALHFAEKVDLSELSILGMLTHACETMLDAFGQISRYNTLIYDGPNYAKRWRMYPGGAGELWLEDTRENPNAFPEATESAFTWMVCGPRLFDQTRFCRAVHVTHKAPSYRSEYERIFEAPVTFESDRNALLIDASWPGHRIADRKAYAFGVLSRHAENLLRERDNASSIRRRVEALLIRDLHTGDNAMVRVAADMGLSRQTLFRRLRAEGVTFEKLLDDLRREMAHHYLESKKVSVNETAYLVGFSDPAAFSRAFKRWTGRSPGKAAANGR